MNDLALGFVSDEIDPDFATALSHARQWGISLFELRCLKTGRVPDVDPQELAGVEGLVREHGVRITALSPGIFKHPITQQAELRREVTETLPRTIALAKRLHTDLIIVFGFKRTPADAPSLIGDVIALFREAADTAEAAGIRLAVENEPGFWCDTGANTARIIEQVGSRAFGANWDPCNAYGTTERPYPEGYEALRRHIINVHAKDTRQGGLIECLPIGEGVIDWQGQMQALMADRIVSHVSIETHCLPLVEKSRQNLQTLRRMMNAAPAHRQGVA